MAARAPLGFDPEETLAHFKAIVESSEDAIISKTLEGIILTWNPGAEHVYGYSAAEAIGHPMTVLLPGDRPDEETSILERLRRGERVQHFETIRRRKGGELIHVSLTISPIRDKRGRTIGASHIARDITERQKVEEQLRLTQKLESLGVLAGGVAHDFNNLLTGILGNASLALDTLAPGNPTREMLRDVVKASERAAHLTGQLLAYAGKGRFLVDFVNLSDLVREMSTLVRTSISKNVHLRLELGGHLPSVEADPSQMQQLVMNLIINAAEAIAPQEAGTVLVTTNVERLAEDEPPNAAGDPGLPAGTYVSFEVHDTGCGIDEATLPRIFDPFFTTKFTGRGLGLAAVQGIIRGHKGAMQVHSRPGKGTRFKVLLPVVAEAQATIGGATASLDPTAGTGLVLVIDDEDIVRRTAKAMLERYGYAVVLAENGKEGVDLFHVLSDKIRVVLLDMTMPVMNGEETLQRLKAIDPNVKVILSSGYNEVEVIRRFTGAGLAGFIQKPYSAAALAQKIGPLVQERKDQRHA
jgi:PAS domain S-box-containing protein